MAQTFFVDDDIQRMYSLDGIITVVDAKHILARLDDEKPEGVENEAVEQARWLGVRVSVGARVKVRSWG